MSAFSIPIGDVRPHEKGDGDTRCQNCGRQNPCWSIDNYLWNAIVGDDPDREAAGVLCPLCFIAKAKKTGFDRCWQLTYAPANT